MKNLPWKKIGIGMAGALVFIGISIYFYEGRGSKPAAPYINPAFAEFISSYTTGMLNSGSTIRIVLAKDAVDSATVGQETSVRLFSFSPSVSGKTVWLDQHTVEFRPEGRLSPGQIYNVGFLLSKLMEVPSGLETFEYTFQVIPQNFELSIDNVNTYVKTELKRQKIEGTLFTADFAEQGAVEKMIEAVQEGSSLKVTWVHNPDGKRHNFIVENVARKEKPSAVKVSVSGDALGIDRAEIKEVEIPSLSDFKLMNAQVVQSPNQYVLLQFSDPLKDKQSLDGLIRISDLSSLDFEIKDNEIRIYPPVRQAGTKTVVIEMGIRNILNYKMKAGTQVDVTFEQLKPMVRFTGKGSILPGTDGLVLPFEAVNLRSVDVEVKKVFENNILQFLQVNRLDGNDEMQRVGKTVVRKTISLDNTGVTDLGRWNRFTLDLATLIQADPGAIYQVSLGFKKAYSTFDCGGEGTGENDVDIEEGADLDFSIEEGEDGEGYYYYEGYEWEQRENPCHISYFIDHRPIKKNILASDIGLIAKCGSDGRTLVVVNDLKTTLPMSGVQLEAYDYQQQVMAKASTDSEGKAFFETEGQPFVIVASSGAQRGYLRLQDGESLSVSQFDVSGEEVKKGIKGILYGERGVWRPGDSLHLTFVLEDKNKVIPDNHPVVFELHSPQGQVVHRIVRAVSENGFYDFATATSSDAITGNWSGRVKVGGTEFSYPLKIETVKPNRLKIALDVGGEEFTSPDVVCNLNVKWLHGAPARNLKAEFDVLLATVPTVFPKYKDYVFEDPARTFYSETQQIYSGYTDGEGHASFNARLESSAEAPGFLQAIFRGKVFEEGGNFSTDRFSIPYYPYASYTGLRMPQGERYTHILYTDSTQRADIVTLDKDGKPLSRDGVEMTLFKLDQRWWWDNSSGNVANYIEGNYANAVARGTVSTVNGKGSWKFKVKSPDWGRYFVRACDPASGHCTGKVIYMDEPGWYSRRGDENRGAASLLSFTTDKVQYNIGEKVKLTIPGSAQGRAFISIENGSRVLQTYWIETQAGNTPFSFEVTPEMAPNVFIHAMLLQPHAQTVNDLPIRLYGVVPVRVEDPMTHLQPVIAMSDVLEPGKEVRISVSEKTNRKMTYTLAVVDEGLLDLTRFKTPDLWGRFYAREALGVRTWDVYEEVMGAYGARLERLLAIGGDGELEKGDDDARANRFKPVVKFFGPFTLDGGKAAHTFIMPQYIGSVRTMVVAGYEGAYGRTEKATPVRKPLMVLTTLPRVLGPEEKVKLPVTLFTQDKNLRNVNIEVSVSGPVKISGDHRKSVTIPPGGDLTVEFDLEVMPSTGKATVKVTATSGNASSQDIIEIDVRNPNTPVTRVTENVIESGKSWNGEAVPFGVSGTNSAILEVSNIPPINLGSRLRYLFQYPYGCIEQTTSSVFPQLFVDQIKPLTENESAFVQRNVTAGIERIKSFMHRDGGFTYWPGLEVSDPWGSSYAGHFLVEAEAKGFLVPGDLLKRWKKYQKNKALEWRRDNRYFNSDLMQAYRLYTLALAGSPEMGAMNRLRESEGLQPTASWMLAASYARSGQPEAAKKIMDNLTLDIKPYREMGYCYGSDLRDKALILETLVLVKDKNKAFELLKEISARLSNSGYWMSTQEVAFSLKAISSFVGLEGRGELKFNYTINGKTVSASTALPMAQVTIPIKEMKPVKVQVTSESKGTLFARLIMEGTPARGQEEDAESNLSLSIRYTDASGQDLDPTRLTQGTAFVAEVTVTHPGIRSSYGNMALAQVFPSGWEINNLRLEGTEQFLASDPATYQDIRDDRVYTYFDIARGTKKRFKVMLTASYAGTYYLPATSCEGMYDNSVYARKKGQVVEVVKNVAVP